MFRAWCKQNRFYIFVSVQYICQYEVCPCKAGIYSVDTWLIPLQNALAIFGVDRNVLVLQSESSWPQLGISEIISFCFLDSTSLWDKLTAEGLDVDPDQAPCWMTLLGFHLYCYVPQLLELWGLSLFSFCLQLNLAAISSSVCQLRG